MDCLFLMLKNSKLMVAVCAFLHSAEAQDHTIESRLWMRCWPASKEVASPLSSDTLGFKRERTAAKDAFVRFLIDAKEKRKVVIGYGAAAKGNTLLNYAGVRPDLFQFVVDLNPAKQGKFLPGSRIPIKAEKALISAEPDFVVVLPWNLRAEVAEQLSYIRKWGGKFVIAIPDLVVF